MKRTALTAMLLLAACTGPLAGDEPTTGPADLSNGQAGSGSGQPPQPPTGEGDRLLVLPGMTLDLDSRQITLQARVGLREGLLELLVCREKSGRGHESILQTPAAPSDVHAALLALGLAPGVPARWMPLPDGAYQAIPPRGGGLEITLRWTDDDGEVRQCPATDWLRPTAPGRAPADGKDWVFVGSEFMPNGAYWADATGEVITVSNFPSTLIDVPFESTTDDSQLLYQANTSAIPPLGTSVEVVITPLAGAEEADHARAAITIDRNGDIHADGQVLLIDDVDDWAMDFTAVHRKGQVVIHTDPRALSHRIRQVRQELRIGGFYEIHELRMDVEEQLLPRTPQQMQTALDELEYDLTHPEELLEDPYRQADLLLEQIQRERQELQRLDDLWRQYADRAAEAVDRYPRPVTPQTDDHSTQGQP